MPKKQRESKNPKAKPEMLGTGMSRKSAEAATEYSRKRDCILNGGKWVAGKGCIM